MRSKQLSLNIYQGHWGGRRPGSGRKRLHSKGVSHRAREKVSYRTPLHINFKYQTLIRNKFCLKLLKRAIVNARSHGLKIVHFSLQSNHVHLIVECESNFILSKGMRSLTVTFAKGLERGKVQLERYHLHVLKSVSEAKNAANYVLFNQQRNEKGTYSKIDEYSSLPSQDKALAMIRRFAQLKKMKIYLAKGEIWPMDKERSYFLRKAINSLTSS